MSELKRSQRIWSNSLKNGPEQGRGAGCKHASGKMFDAICYDICSYFARMQLNRSPSRASHLVQNQKTRPAVYKRWIGASEGRRWGGTRTRRTTYRGGIAEVDERVAEVALVLEVNGKVEEVICARIVAIDEVEQVALRVLIWDVLDHNRSARVLARLCPRHIQGKSLRILTV